MPDVSGVVNWEEPKKSGNVVLSAIGGIVGGLGAAIGGIFGKKQQQPDYEAMMRLQAMQMQTEQQASKNTQKTIVIVIMVIIIIAIIGLAVMQIKKR